MNKKLRLPLYIALFALFIFAVVQMSHAVFASTVKEATVTLPAVPAIAPSSSSAAKPLAVNTVKKATPAKTTAKKTTVKKPVKKAVKKKAVKKKKKSVNLNPPLITVETAPHSPKP